MSMRVRADRWVWGLPLLAALWWAATLYAEPRLEAELSGIARALVQASIEDRRSEPWLSVGVSGRDLIATGEAPNSGARGVLGKLAGITGVRRVEDRTDLTTTPAHFVLKAQRDGNRITVEGFRPAELVRADFDERLHAALPDGTVLEDATRSGAGAPDQFVEATLLAITEAMRLDAGRVEISDRTVSLWGAARDQEGYNRVRAALRGLPPGFSAGTVEVEPPSVQPYAWSIERRGEDGALLLRGYVPSERLRAEVAAAAERIAPGLVTDEMQTATGFPSGIDYLTTARFALTEIGQMQEGTVWLDQNQVGVKGAAIKGVLQELALAFDRSLPQGLTKGPVELRPAVVVPYRFSARRTADTVVLEGYYPDERARAAILKLVRPRFFGEAILDRGRLADGAPPGFVAGVGVAIEQLSYLAGGEASLTGTALSLRGEALYAQTAERMRETATATAPSGWTVEADIRLKGSGPAAGAAPAAAARP